MSSEIDEVFIVIDKSGRGGELIDSVWIQQHLANRRKENINGFRVETHKTQEKLWTKEDEIRWTDEEQSILAEQENHNFGDS